MCFCKNDAGTNSFSSSSIDFLIILALLSPQATKRTLFAFIMVFIPIEIASFGTLLIPPNSLAASNLVVSSILTFLVTEDSIDPGSLNPICPFLPMPRSWRSKPPAFLILFSKSTQCFSILFDLIYPLGILILFGSISICLNRFSNINLW